MCLCICVCKEYVSAFFILPELGNQSVQLLCRADSNPPAEFTWLPGSPRNVTITQNAAMLELHLAEVPKDATFTCHARNYLGSQTVSVRLSVLCEWGEQEGSQGSWSTGWGYMFLIPLSSHSTPTAAGPPVHLGGSDSTLLLLHPWLACPFPELVAGT